ncbi:hypothetical protein AB0E01_23200 [Nocardia vinacea]|uniref:hypothetical protein n=1 Tax=Nocardia vinacea TaxID=96468 RepID=UPI0033CA0641
MTIMSQTSLLADAPASLSELANQINTAAEAKLASGIDSAAAEIATRRLELAKTIADQELDLAKAATQQTVKSAMRARKVQDAIARADHDAQLWEHKADADERRITNPHGKVALLKKVSTRIDYALFGVVGIGIGLSALNVQRTIATHGAADPLTWLAFGMEAMVSIPIVVTMVVAALGMRLGESFNRKPFIAIEAALLLAAVALNAAPHIMAGDVLASIQFGSAPALMAFSVALHGLVSGLLSKWMRKAALEANREREFTNLSPAAFAG